MLIMTGVSALIGFTYGHVAQIAFMPFAILSGIAFGIWFSDWDWSRRQ